MLSIGSRHRGPWVALALVITAVVLVACGGAALAPAPAGPNADGAGRDPAAPPGFLGGDGEGSDGGADGNGRPAYYDLDQPDLLIIKTGSIAIQVAGLDEAVAAASAAMVRLGGYASASERSGDEESAYASVTYRIPAARWDEALAAIRGLGQKVLDERSGTEDVTGQVVDLGARITNLRATEGALQQIMTRATEIEDVLKVQAELTRVRSEIEQLTAQKSHLEEQAAMSTLTAVFSLTPNPVLTSQKEFDPGAQVDEATASLVRILQAVAAAGIWFAIVWLPILVVVGILVLLGALIVRRFRRPAPTALANPGA